MKAIASDRYGSAEVLALREVGTPSIGDDEVLVEVHAAAADPGVWIMMTGRPYAARLAGGLRRPRVPVIGRSHAGVVAAVGAKVTRLRPGDAVYGTADSGSFAEFTRARERRLARMPGNLTFEQAAAVPISAVTALQAVRDARIEAGRRVLVIGAGGGVGTFAVQLIKQRGAIPVGVCGPSKVSLVRSLGAADVIDYTRQEIDASGVSYDAIIDTAGNRPLSLLRRAVAADGTIALVGGGHARWPLMGGFGRQLAAPLISPFGRARLVGVTAREHHDDLDELTPLLESGAVVPVVGRTYALADAPDAIRHLEEGHATGKLVITVR
ncbi:NAD(P)-dependent alcohol dehydrogenase [Actinoplanes missouriensis]|uniref:NAD(P)-dependent alcohol dehydrogenase n=1 Tax=Actinoplanes missouriensis TaxID=1866 RepID=UPI00340EAA2E